MLLALALPILELPLVTATRASGDASSGNAADLPSRYTTQDDGQESRWTKSVVLANEAAKSAGLRFS